MNPSNRESVLVAKLGDFNYASYVIQEIIDIKYNTQLRPPEVLFGLPAGHPIDWWSIGTLIYELLIGKEITEIDNTKRENITFIEKHIGEIPKEILDKGKFTSNYYYNCSGKWKLKNVNIYYLYLFYQIKLNILLN